MKKYAYILLTLLTALFASSCESYLVNGDLDGFWQARSIEDKQSGEITQCKGDIYYSFQREIVLVSYVSPTIPVGQIKENHIAYFCMENDSITMTDFRIYLDKEATPTPLSKLEKFGLYEKYNKFHVEKLTGESLILNSERTRITLRKY